MSNRLTPETDAEHAQFAIGGFTLDFCRKLERERDEARTTIEDAKRALNATDYEGILLAAMRVKEERDELLAELEEYRSIAENIGAKKAVSEKEKAIRERDEARELLASEKITRDHIINRSVEVERERDKAREALKNARELNKWLTVFLEHIRDNADIRYGKHRGLLAFSDLREEASRKWKEATK